MNEIDKAKEYATKEWPIIWSELSCDVQDKVARVMAGFATATAKIERLEKALKQARLDFAFLSVRNLGKSIADKAVEAIDKALEPKDGEL